MSRVLSDHIHLVWASALHARLVRARLQAAHVGMVPFCYHGQTALYIFALFLGSLLGEYLRIVAVKVGQQTAPVALEIVLDSVVVLLQLLVQCCVGHLFFKLLSVSV